MTSLSAIVLAGGNSRRMGTDKALLKLPDGQSLLSRTVQVAQTLTPHVMVVTPWPERYKAILPLTVQLVTEQPNHRNGPLGGFAQGLSNAHTDWCLVLACDLPQLESEPLRDWWEWLQVRSISDELGSDESGSDELSEAIASLAHCEQTSVHTLPVHTKKWEPLCGFYRRSCLSSLRRYLAAAATSKDASLSMQGWLATLPVLAYDQIPRAILFNCNTADAWSKFCTQSAVNR